MAQMKMTRKFNGEAFRYQGMHMTKTAACDHVDRIKRKGDKARKVQTSKGWAVYAK